jgi:hypothetical protein
MQISNFELPRVQILIWESRCIIVFHRPPLSESAGQRADLTTAELNVTEDR